MIIPRRHKREKDIQLNVSGPSWTSWWQQAFMSNFYYLTALCKISKALDFTREVFLTRNGLLLAKATIDNVS